jgi:hypothetical protein
LRAVSRSRGEDKPDQRAAPLARQAIDMDRPAPEVPFQHARTQPSRLPRTVRYIMLRTPITRVSAVLSRL